MLGHIWDTEFRENKVNPLYLAGQQNVCHIRNA